MHVIGAAQICNKRTIALQEQQAQARAAAEAAAAQREAERAAAFRRFNAQGNYHASNHLHQFLQHAGPSMGGAYPGGLQVMGANGAWIDVTATPEKVAGFGMMEQWDGAGAARV